MDTETRHSLAELARVAGVTPRTVRYYIAQGLLPGAHDAGPGAWYDDGHLTRLRLIRDLQRQHLPLAEIRGQLATLGDDEIAELVAERSITPEPASGSALDYIRGVLGGRVGGGPIRGGTLAGPLAPDAPPILMSMPPPLPSAAPTPPQRGTLLKRAFVADPGTGSTPDPSSSQPSPDAPSSERSQWDRIALTPDIELHVRRPLARHDNRLVERLITIARQVLKEEQP